MRVAMTVLPIVLMASCTALSGVEDLGIGPAAPLEGEPDSSTPREAEGGPGPVVTPDGDVVPQEDAGPDGAIIADTGADAPKPVENGPPRFVQMKYGNLVTNSLSNFVDTMKDGSLIVVAIGKESATINSVTDNTPGVTNTYVRTSFSSSHPASNCGDGVSAEIWYAKNIRGGGNLVTVNFSNSEPVQAWIYELAQMDPFNPVDVGAVTNSGPLSSQVTAPKVTPTVAESFIVSIGMCCSSITGLKSGSPFTATPIQRGNSTAYMLNAQPGSYGAEWNSDSARYCSSTVAFK